MFGTEAMRVFRSEILRGEKLRRQKLKVALSKGSLICQPGASLAVAMVMRSSMKITNRGK